MTIFIRERFIMILLSHLSAIDDPRRREGRRFELAYLLLFTLLAIISGANSYRAITRFMQVRLDWFKSLTGIRWPRAPSHTGLRKCLLKLDGNEIEAALRRHAGDNAESALIAVDGKTLRGSLDRFADKAAVQWISAFAGHEKIVLGHIELAGGDKGGEIGAAQELIGALGLTGKLFTFDALHCQKKLWKSSTPLEMTH
jgi:hypothetical protein